MARPQSCDRHAHGDSDPYCNAHEYHNADRHSYGDGDANLDTGERRHTDPYAHRDRIPNRNAHEYYDADYHTYRDGDANLDADTHRHTDEHAYRDSNANSDADGHRHADTHANCDCYEDGDADCNCHCVNDSDEHNNRRAVTNRDRNVDADSQHDTRADRHSNCHADTYSHCATRRAPECLPAVDSQGELAAMDSEELRTLADLIRDQRTAALGTLRNGAPFVSMVLYATAPDFSEFYIHTSKLAQHTRDILADARVSLMIAETDLGDRDPQTLARVSVMGESALLAEDDPGYAAGRAAYLEKHPQTAFLFGFADFAMYRLPVESARYVAGFAKAYNLKVAQFREASLVQS